MTLNSSPQPLQEGKQWESSLGLDPRPMPPPLVPVPAPSHQQPLASTAAYPLAVYPYTVAWCPCAGSSTVPWCCANSLTTPWLSRESESNEGICSEPGSSEATSRAREQCRNQHWFLCHYLVSHWVLCWFLAPSRESVWRQGAVWDLVLGPMLLSGCVDCLTTPWLSRETEQHRTQQSQRVAKCWVVCCSLAPLWFLSHPLALCCSLHCSLACSEAGKCRRNQHRAREQHRTWVLSFYLMLNSKMRFGFLHVE